jgi:hypothetical protein
MVIVVSDDFFGLYLHNGLELCGNVDFTGCMLSRQILELIFLIFEHNLVREGFVKPKIESH